MTGASSTADAATDVPELTSGLAGFRTIAVGGILAIAATALYLLTGPTDAGGDAYIPLAGALLHGSFTIEARSWIELIPTDTGWLVPFPPVPVLFYLPVVAVMGVQPWSQELSVGVMPAIVGGASVGLAFVMLRRRVGVAEAPAVWITLGFATTTLWWVAGIGGTHLMAQVCAVLFLLAAVYLALGHDQPVLAGVCFALAVGSRLPIGVALPLFIYLYRERTWRFLMGALPVAVIVGLYNYARFESFFDFGYARIPSDEGLVTDEPWYTEGIESPLYITRGFEAAFLSWPKVLGTAPFIQPNLYADSLLLTAPFLGGVVLARGRLALVTAGTAVLVLLVDFMHGNPGFAQFGYRFVLDSMPLWLVVLGLGLPDRAPVLFRLAVIFGAAVTAYGFWATSIGFAGF